MSQADLRASGPAPGAAAESKGVTPNVFRQAMRALSGGVCIVATGAGDDRRGLTATAVCSLSADPPMLIACINRSTQAFAVARDTGSFSVNVLSTDHLDLARCFAGGDRVGVERFALGTWSKGPTDAPLLEGSLCAFDCRVAAIHEFGTHGIFVGFIEHLQMAAAAPPLLYGNGAFCRLVELD